MDSWRGLSSTADPHFALSYELLENVVLVRSCVLLLESTDSQDLLKNVLSSLLAANAKGPRSRIITKDTPQSVCRLFTDMIVCVLDECEIVLPDTLQILLEALVCSHPPPPSFSMAVDIVLQSSSRLQPFIAQERKPHAQIGTIHRYIYTGMPRISISFLRAYICMHGLFWLFLCF